MVTAPNTRLNNQRREKSLKKGLWYFKNLTREKVYFERNTKKKEGLILNKKGRKKYYFCAPTGKKQVTCKEDEEILLRLYGGNTVKS